MSVRLLLVRRPSLEMPSHDHIDRRDEGDKSAQPGETCRRSKTRLPSLSMSDAIRTSLGQAMTLVDKQVNAAVVGGRDVDG